jgi:hypothetical protein
MYGRALHIEGHPMQIKRLLPQLLVVALFLALRRCTCKVTPPTAGRDDDAHEYIPTTIPSNFRPSADHSSIACNNAFYHVNVPSNACKLISPLPRIAAQNLSVMLCSKPHLGSGRIIFLDTSESRVLTRVYRAKMVGPEAFLLPITYCNTQLATATYSVTIPGAYTLELLQLFHSFSYNLLSPMLRDFSLLPALLAINITGVHHSAPAAGRTSCSGASCPLCRTADAPGRWLVHPKLAPFLATTCNPSPGTPFCHNTSEANRSGLFSTSGEPTMRWQPYGCSLRAPSDVAACKAQLPNVCFVGDSQMRHLFNGFVRPEFNLKVSWPGTTGRQGADKSTVHHPTYQFFRISWGHEFAKLNITRCSSLVINLGQWHISKASFRTINGSKVEYPWSPARYLKQMDVVAKQLQAAKQAGTRVFWATINSHGYIDRFVNRTDFRTEPWLLLFNSIAATVMHQHHIPVIDTYSITDVFKDLTYDGAHYKGYVGHWATAAVAHDLCNEHHPAYPKGLATVQPPASQVAASSAAQDGSPSSSATPARTISSAGSQQARRGRALLGINAAEWFQALVRWYPRPASANA